MSDLYTLDFGVIGTDDHARVGGKCASLGQMTFVVFFAGPPLLGFVAQSFGIRMSYFAILPLVIGALLVIRALPGRPVPLRQYRAADCSPAPRR